MSNLPVWRVFFEELFVNGCHNSRQYQAADVDQDQKGKRVYILYKRILAN